MSTMISPVAGRVSSEWSRMRRNPATGRYSSHAGIDIAAPTGTDVHAAFGGVVVDVRTNSYRGDKRLWRGLKSGNFVLIRNTDNAHQWYGHLSSVSVKKGQKVKQGQVIAEVGATGQVTGSHLHFETWSNARVGSNFNPRILFVRYGVEPGSKPAGAPDSKPVKAYRDLKKGMKGDDVRRVQSELRSEGYTRQLVTGNYLAQTEANILDFQRRTGLVQDGIAGEKTQKRLGI